ncbi:calcium ion binding protein [Aureococcus anophagefferens]|nr:calcium ion binding protein [Aureococcus anophagefferens]
MTRRPSPSRLIFRVAATDKVVLYGDAAPSSSGDVSTWKTFNTTWIVTEGGLEGNEGLEAWARTDVAISGSARDREHDLVLASGALVAGATYAFRLEATLAGRAAVGAASVSFYVARPPSSGKLEVLPAAGFALETTFALATYSWVTEDAPLQYAFKTRVNGSESTLQVATRQPSLENVVLPEGSPNVTVVVVATDALGGEAEAAAGVRVSPTELDGVALANLTTSLLDSAFALGNTEGVCQTVVAAAGAADAALTATLIDAVAAIAATSTPTNSVGILANISVGITAVAAASLATRSGVLESELFAAYTSPNASNSSSRRLAESAGDTLGLALDGIARAQLNGAVEGEFASEVKSTKLRMSSQKLSTLGEEATVLEAEDSSVSLGVALTGDATFAQFDVNQHAAEPGGSEATTKLVRFGRLQGNGSKVSLALGASSVSASNQTGGNATCPPGGGGNVSFACADGSVLSAPCPATGVREATVVSFTCPFTEAGCAFWDGSAWSAPPDCETVVDGGDVTCVCAVVDDALDFSATSNSVLGTYASAFTSLSGRDLVSSPLLYWTVFTMALGCFVVGVIGFFLDRRDAAKKSDNAAKKGGDIGCLSLEGLVAESMPGFVEELGHPFAWACRMLWKNHSWCKILSTHMPANPRPRRCVTLFFSLLMIMFGQAVAFWFAYPVGFCDGAEFQRNCEAKKTLYAEFIAGLTGEEVVRDACVWYVLEFATHFFTVRFRYDVPPEGTTEFCQLRTPEAQDIGFKRLLLIFLGVIMAIPFTEIFDATFVKYVCAPLKSCGYVHVLTGVAKRDAIAAFARFDTDGSGAIDSYELVCAMEAMGLPKPSNKDVSRMMSGAEELDRDQFMAMMAQHPKMMARAAALGANVVDVEGDGENVAPPLDRYWGISQSEIAETATTFGERVKAQLTFATAQTFAERVFHHLVESQQVAVAYGRRARSVGDDRRAARVIINMMRREFFSATEVKIFEQQLAPTFRRDEGEPERLPPVSLSAKVVATMLCLGAFLGPMLFLSIFASAVGNAMTRAWYFSTVFFVFIAVFIVEPFSVFVLKVAVPASIYEKLRWMQDPTAVTRSVLPP